MEMTQENFDLQAWQQQGQEALNNLLESRTSLVSELNVVDQKIGEIKDALGVEKKTRRTRIRPVILDILAQNIGQWLTLDSVVTAACQHLDGVEAASVTAAVRRAIREFDNLEEVDSKVRMVDETSSE